MSGFHGIFWLRYVAHAKVGRYEAIGWRVVGSNLGSHGFHSCLMRFDGAEPTEPK